jgi:hypothetical protein
VRTFQVTLLSVALYVSFSSNSSSGETSQVTPPKKTLPHEILAYFSGTWSGKGNAGSGQAIESNFRFVPDLANQCLIVREQEKPPSSYRWIALWSTDSVSGDLVMLLTSNGNWGARVFRSLGWQNDKLVFQSVPELRAQFGLERFTYERKSDSTFDSTFEMSTDNGNTWRKGEHQVYTKVRSR